MRVTCECGAKYRYDESKFQGAAEKRIDCPKCGKTIVVHNPDLFSTKIHEEVLDSGLKRLAEPKFTLSIMRGVSGGQVIQLNKERVTIGRMDADVQIDDPEASRIHAELLVQGERVLLRDLNSSNGTFVDGERIREVTLQDDAEFQIGQTLFAIHKVLVSFDS